MYINPNYLTYFRLIGSFFLFLFLKYHYFISFLLLFLICAISDFFDGYIARKNNKVSFWGATIDRLSDKIMVYSTFFFLLKNNCINDFIFYGFIIRDLSISALREYYQKYSLDIPSDYWGKTKTFILSITLFSNILVKEYFYSIFIEMHSFFFILYLFLLILSLISLIKILLNKIIF